MADLHPSEDQAVLYLLDRLPADERREFEARLAESAELRALLRDLEEGSVALTMAVPLRRPPAQIWSQIERTVAGEQKRTSPAPSFWFSWWRYGWAAAAVCLAGWLFQAIWLNWGPNSSGANSQQAIRQPDIARTESRDAVAVREPVAPPPQTGAALPTFELLRLRQQVADLSNQITHLSQSVTQQQALLLEANRLKFFQLTGSTDGAPATNAPVSPGLQRALFIAMARELGWLPPGSSADLPSTGTLPLAQRDQRPTTTTNIAGVDFVDLRSGSNAVANPPQTDAQPGNASDPNLLTAASAGGVPGFISGTNAILAFDSSVAAHGMVLSFWSGAPGQWYQLIGSSVIGNNPTVVTVPFSSAGGATLTVTAGNGAGGSNILGQFPPTPRWP